MEGDGGRSSENWERKVLERLVFESLVEQRRRRRWGVFFKLLGLAFVGLIVFRSGDWSDPAERLVDGKGYVAMVSIDGVIEPGGGASAEQIIDALQLAYADRSVQGVVLRLNSPGGSPVQAGMINDEIARLRQMRPELKVAAVVEDVCASGGYYVAAAADTIYVDKASLVGSIGVLMDNFGFVGAMEKVGVERRLLFAGESKGFLDPFSPQRPEHLVHARGLLAQIHQQFIDVVRKGRGDRLREVPEMFSGLVWTGQRSIELGLADGFGTVESVARDVFQVSEVRDFTRRGSLVERFAEQFGANVSERLLASFGRFNLR